MLLETRALSCPSNGYLIQNYNIVSNPRQDTKYPNPVLSTSISVGACGRGVGAARRGGMQEEERGRVKEDGKWLCCRRDSGLNVTFMLGCSSISVLLL